MIFDIEANGLDDASKIHVLAYTEGNRVCHTHDYEEMRKVLTSAKTLIGHNIQRYDIPTIERILEIKITARLIDTLALSWYLNHSRLAHGLEGYGVDYGVPKPVVTDWDNQPPEVYAERCIEDVKINRKLWKDLRTKLLRIYDTKEDADRFLRYLEFKMDCAVEQERSGWKLDVKNAQRYFDELSKLEHEKIEELKKHMPPVVKYAKKTKPKKPFKKDGTYSSFGANWFALLRREGLPEDFDGVVSVAVSEEEPNPGSTPQIKDWLFSLGWEPETFKYVRDGDSFEERAIPQVRVETEVNGVKTKELCPSVLELAEKEPSILVLEGLTIIQHRLSIFKGFLENQRDGWVKAEIQGLTNTLRFKHKVVVNLPGVDKLYGGWCRGVLTAPDGYELCGSDMSSLEDTTKRHYMYPYDPEYVEEMSKPGFDPHLDLAKYAKVVTQEEIDSWKQGDESVKDLKPIRTDYKTVNYSATYGVRPKKLSRTIKSTIKKASKLLDDFWARNWSLKKIAEDTYVKKVGNELWLYNPVSRFYYSLRYEKDIFSTLNQGTGVYCFDSWVKEVRTRRPQLTAQFHDEIIACLKVGHRDQYTKILKEAIKVVNDRLKLNVKLDIDVKFGDTYADIH